LHSRFGRDGKGRKEFIDIMKHSQEKRNSRKSPVKRQDFE
jgi:hypothetical protein